MRVSTVPLFAGGGLSRAGQASQLGSAIAAKQIDVPAGQSPTVDLEMRPVNVDASTGKRLAGGLVEAGVQDIVIENALEQKEGRL